MKVLLMGDVHGKFDFAHQAYQQLAGTYKTIDLLIQVGDFGFWPRLNPFYEWSGMEHPCIFVDGNHEDHETLLSLDQPDWGLERGIPKAWQRTMNTWKYAPRGSIWNGILFIGGASSINKIHLHPGLNWFPEEDISMWQMERTIKNIESYGPENIHTVISHEAPAAFRMEAACTYGNGEEIIDTNRKFLQKVLELVRPEQWYFGHYHAQMSGFHTGTNTSWRCIDQITGPYDQDHVYEEMPPYGNQTKYEITF